MRKEKSFNLKDLFLLVKFRSKLILPLVLLLFFCSVATHSNAQNRRITLKLENNTLAEALKKTSILSGLEFFYNANEVGASSSLIRPPSQKL